MAGKLRPVAYWPNMSNDYLVGGQGVTLTRQWHEKTFWDEENAILSYMVVTKVYNCQILLNWTFTLKKGSFYLNPLTFL